MLNTWVTTVDWNSLLSATWETIYMTLISVIITFILGVFLGLTLFLTEKGNLWENKFLNLIIASVVNIFRSIPFIILIILLIPFTVIVMGTMLGANAALPALIIGSAPFYARLVEIALREIDKGVIEAARSMGATNWQIIYKVLLPEAMPALVSGITVSGIALVSFTAMAGVIGAGGLGNLAYLKGFQSYNTQIMVYSTVLILLIVYIIQIIGDAIIKKIDKR